MTSVNRRRFLRATSGLAASGIAASVSALTKADDKPRLNYRLGIVTYNIAAHWDIPTILKVCQQVGLSPVELRTTHKHGVEPSLSKAQRREVRQRFADATIQIWGSGTTCEFHSPDPAEVKKNIETCKAFVQLVSDIGGRGVKVRMPTSKSGSKFTVTARHTRHT